MQWEKRIFGCCSSEFYRPDHIPWQTAVGNVIKLQEKLDWDPARPKTPIGLELFECVQSYLYPEAAKRLRFYCAIGTAFDFWHGVDGFLAIDHYKIFIDVSVMKQVEKNGVLLFYPEDSGQHLWRFAKRVSDRFAEQFIVGRTYPRGK